MIVAPVDPKKSRRRVARETTAAEATRSGPPGDERAGQQQPNPAPASRKSAIVTMHSAGEDMTPEEHQRRGDAADALFREIVRRVAGKA
jgi:hypothetical protein